MRFRTCGDSGVLVELADLDETLRVFAALRSSEAAGIPGSNALDAVTQLIPAARTILISFDPLLASRADIIAAVRALDVSTDVYRRSRTVEIPVIYDGEDLADIAQSLGVSVPQVIARHCAHAWSVAFVGFAPGFAYLTGGDEIFDVPRRKVPPEAGSCSVTPKRRCGMSMPTRLRCCSRVMPYGSLPRESVLWPELPPVCPILENRTNTTGFWHYSCPILQNRTNGAAQIHPSWRPPRWRPPARACSPLSKMTGGARRIWV